MKALIIPCLFLLAGCTSQFSLEPAATWASNAPVIPGFTPIPLGNGGFIEEPNSALTPPTTPDTPIEQTLTGLQQAQTVRTLVRQLAR